MPKLTLVLERKPVQVYELSREVISIGRVEGLDIVIDNVSVSRRQAQIRQEDDGSWSVRDMGSANGTFLNGERLTDPRPLRPGDEISFGKFSLFFERVFEEPVEVAQITFGRAQGTTVAGTYEMRQEDLERLQQAVALKRRAQLQWEAGGKSGTHYLKGGAALIGQTESCDLRLPMSGPKQDVLVVRGEDGFEVRNLSSWHRMKVNGQVTARVALKSGDTIDVGGVRLTFLDEVR